MIDEILPGDALTILKKMPPASVNCIVTSPPYWGLRDYGHNKQLGLEITPTKYVNSMVKIFKECFRVLKSDGTLWLNVGDTYIGGKGANGASGTAPINSRARISTVPGMTRVNDRKQVGLKPKDLVGIPWMLAFALRKSGWYLRQDIIWHKPNPMPESIFDRCTKSHEYIFLFSKSRKYYFDAASIATPVQSVSLKAAGRRSGNKSRKSGTERGCPADSLSNQASHVPWEGVTANKRSVWTVGTVPFQDAHFATFPELLVSDCIKAGCPVGGIVLDPFIGSGTTAVVSRKLGRHYLGIELNPDYVKLAKKRIATELGLFK